jgi:hypothetical protein
MFVINGLLVKCLMCGLEFKCKAIYVRINICFLFRVATVKHVILDAEIKSYTSIYILVASCQLCMEEKFELHDSIHFCVLFLHLFIGSVLACNHNFPQRTASIYTLFSPDAILASGKCD